jgi:cytochrome c oxidase subunit 2
MRSSVVVHPQAEYEQWLSENRIAQNPSDPPNPPDQGGQGGISTVAVNPADMTAEEFLAPYTRDLGINTDTLATIHVHH